MMENIVVFQSVLGSGFHESTRDVQSMRILIQINGKLGTEPPDYSRFENALIETALAIERDRAAALRHGSTQSSRSLRHDVPFFRPR
jgi:hypothetical protein